MSRAQLSPWTKGQYRQTIVGTRKRVTCREVHYLHLVCGHTKRVTGSKPPKRETGCFECWTNSPQAR